MIYFHFLFPLFSLPYLSTSEINTPELLEKLRAGSFDVSPSDVFVISSDAHEDILSQPKHFAASKYHSLIFHVENRGEINIKPHEKSVIAYFSSGNQSTLGMPADYIDYQFGISKAVKVSKEDIEYIVQWTNAKKLGIFGENTVAFDLQQRLNKLKALTTLEEVHFDIAMKTYMKLRVKPFADTLTTLKKANFRAVNLSDGRFAMFVKSQTVPNGWKCAVQNKLYYNCTKK